MSTWMRRASYIGVLALAGFGLMRAAQYRFQEKEQAFRKEASAQLQKLGITREAAKAKQFTPEIHMISAACLQPGGVGEVVIRGKFVPGSRVIFENDNIDVVKESLTAAEYRATLKAAPGIGPQSANVMVVSPLTGMTARSSNAAAIVGGKFEFRLQAANGWKVVAKPAPGPACRERGSDGVPYEMLFYRNNEANPFEKRAAGLYFSLWDTAPYRFQISTEDPGAVSAQQKAQDMARKMQDPNLSPAQRDAMIQELMQSQQAMIAKMQDPNFAGNQEAKKLAFGCEVLEVKVDGGAATGSMMCSEKVGRRIAVTGTMAKL
jgi:hypothetical protein